MIFIDVANQINSSYAIDEEQGIKLYKELEYRILSKFHKRTKEQELEVFIYFGCLDYCSYEFLEASLGLLMQKCNDWEGRPTLGITSVVINPIGTTKKIEELIKKLYYKVRNT